MPSEGRLHPASILFGLGKHVRELAVPTLVVLFTAGRTGLGWQIWLVLLIIPYSIATILRYISFRYRYEASEMVIRTGILFKNERHIPYARIQNLDAVQNVLHRLLHVIEVRIETGGGQEPEAKLSVLPVAALDEMRRRVFEGRQTAAAQADVEAAPATAGDVVLALPPREIALSGFIENRGFVPIAAAFGLLWEIGIMDGVVDRLFGEQAEGRGVVREILKAVFAGGGLPIGRIAMTIAAFAGVLLLIRVISMVWAVVRLHGFRLARAGEDLRTEYGLLTRVTTTIPLRRIQTLTVREGPLHRLFARASVRVDTAGGSRAGSVAQREWLAPIIRHEALPGFLRHVLPELDLASVTWEPVAPRAFGRELRGWLIFIVPVTAGSAFVIGWWSVALFAVLFTWAMLASHQFVRRLGWSVTDDAVLFKSGWIWRQVSVARFNKIQAVSVRESPFDRRTKMARVGVDSAGVGDASHRVDIPYLPRDRARELYALLAGHAGRTAFRW